MDAVSVDKAGGGLDIDSRGVEEFVSVMESEVRVDAELAGEVLAVAAETVGPEPDVDE